MLLCQFNGDQAAQGVSPGQNATRSADRRSEVVNEFHICLDRIGNRPPIACVGRPSKCVSPLDECFSHAPIARTPTGRRLRCRRHGSEVGGHWLSAAVAMGVQQQRAVPLLRHDDLKRGTVDDSHAFGLRTGREGSTARVSSGVPAAACDEQCTSGYKGRHHPDC